MDNILAIHSDNDSLFGITKSFIRITSGIICMTEIALISQVESFVGNTDDLRRALIIFEDEIEFKQHHKQLIVKNDSLGVKLNPIENDEVLSEIPINLHLYSIDYNLKSFGIAINRFPRDIVEISINPNGELGIGNMIVYPITESQCHSESIKISTKYIKKFLNTLCNYSIIKICISPPSRFIIDNITFYIAPICDEDTTQS